MMGKLHLNAGGDRTDQPQAKDMGFDYGLVNTAGFVTDSTLDNAKERPRYGTVHPTGFARNATDWQKQKHLAVNWLVQKSLTGWITRKTINRSSYTLHLPRSIARWPHRKSTSICIRNI